MTVSIREPGAGDVALLRELLGVFGAAFDDAAAYTAAQPGDDYLSRLLGSENFLALVAVENEGAGERVVGGLTGYELVKFEQERKEIHLYDLAVLESHRRQGIGTELIERLKEIARRRGAAVIFVQADAEDAPAIALYSRLGRREEVFHFDIEVAEPPAGRGGSAGSGKSNVAEGDRRE